MAALLATASAQADDLDLTGFYLGGFVDQGTSTNVDNPSVPVKHSAPYLGGFAGYAVDLGSTIIGIEALVSSETHGHLQYQAGYSYQYPSSYISNYPVDTPGVPTTGSRDYVVDGVWTQREAIQISWLRRETLVGQVGIRVGKQFGNWVIYGRLGGGISQS
ncbi:hypothetical protein AB4144_31470, partial [Rhizobiaceae sp. 2RAB30]